MHAQLSSEARGLNSGLHFHVCPFTVYMSNKGLGETARMRRLA